MKILTNIRKQYQDLTESNNHTEAAIVLATALGKPEDVTILEFIKLRCTVRGHITESEQRERDKISNRYYRLLNHILKQNRS